MGGYRLIEGEVMKRSKKDRIQIAEDVWIECKIKQNWLQRKIIQWLTGWRYEKGGKR